MAEPDQTYLQQTQSLLPEYKEALDKSILFSAFDPYAGYAVDADGNPIVDADGNPVQITDPAISGTPLPEGQTFVSQPTGLLTESMLANVPKPTVAQFTYTDPVTGEEITSGFTPAQAEAIKLGIANTGSYQDMFDAASDTYAQGLGTFSEAVDMQRLGGAALEGTAAEYDPTSYKSFYDPFVEEVIDTVQADIDDQATKERNRIAASAIGAGAFGGSRQAVAEAELQRNTQREKSRIGAQLRSQAYGQAQDQAASAFENAQNRGQNAASTFANIGQGIASTGASIMNAGTTQMAAGEATQAAGARDVNALYNVGQLEQEQAQKELDVQREAAMEEALEPYNRLSYGMDLVQGVPSGSSTIATGATPGVDPITQYAGYATGLDGLNQAGSGGILGS